jgi:hypothetical protein
MASTTFVDGVTLIVAAWLNDSDSVVYDNFGDGSSYTGNLTVGASTFTVAAASGNTAVGGTLDVTGVATFSSTLSATRLYVDGGSNTFIDESSADVLRIVAGGVGSGFFANGNGAYSGTIVNNGNSTPFGLSVQFSASAPNNGTQLFLTCTDTGGEKFSARSNGGLANVQANNANLSDIRTKPVFEDYTDEVLDDLEERFAQIRRGRFKYADQTHDDWNYGKSAQSVAEHIPELAGVWNPTKVVSKEVNGEQRYEVVPTPEKDQLLCEYSHDITQIGEAILVRLLGRVKKLEASVGV